MWKARISCEWQTTPEGNRPTLVDVLQPGDSMMDVTGQQNIIPSPPTVTWEVWGQATIEAAQADARFLVHETWEEADATV